MLHNEKGVTLIEILVSMAILSIVLLSIVNFFPQMGQMNHYNATKAKGVNLAKEVLVEWKSSPDVLDFLGSPETEPRPDGYSKEDQDYYYFKTTKNQFDVHIKIKKNSDLNSTPAEAHFIQIQLLKEGNKTVSETYGYVIVAI